MALKLKGNKLVWVDTDGDDVVTTVSKGNIEFLNFPVAAR